MNGFNLKVFLEVWEVSPEETFKTFNNWISASSDETLIDVADYSHVHEGPITLLVGHEANYCIDQTDSRLGLLYSRKRLNGASAGQLQSLFTAALEACLRLEREEKLQGRVRFSANQFLLVANDRLNAPNSEASLDALRPELETVLDIIFDRAEFSIERDPDNKRRLAVSVVTAENGDVGTLLGRLNA
jgi:hypothetical protein